MTHDQLMTHARASALRLLRGEDGREPMPTELGAAAARIIARHWIEIDAAKITRCGYVTIAPAARKQARKAARTLARMANLQDRNGTQIGRLAHKVIRGVQCNRLTATELYARTREWRKLRKAVRLAEAADTAALPLRSLQFAGSGITARWLAPRELKGIGHVMNNCLANDVYLEQYRSRLKYGEIEIILLEDLQARPLMVLSVDLECRAVAEVEVASRALGLAVREALITLLCQEKFEPALNDSLLGLAICDQLLEARARRLSTRLRIGDHDCEIGPNFVAVLADETTILLRGPTCDDTNSEVCVVAPEGPDSAYLDQARARQWFRQACGRDAVFAQACRSAFAEADPAFLDDWFC